MAAGVAVGQRNIMAITRTTNGTLIIGDPSHGGRAIGISEMTGRASVVFVDWLEEGVGMELTLVEAVAARDELDRLITRARNAGGA